MARNDTDERQDLEEERGKSAALLVAETVRPKFHHAHHDSLAASKPASESGMSMFWRVFGGTILSIVVLILITICNQFSASLSDLRRDLNSQVESRLEFVKKADLDRTLSSVWTAVKETRVSATVVENLSDKVKSQEQQLDRVAKGTGDDRKELQARIDDNRKCGQEENREVAKKVEELRKTLDEERKDYQRKLDEQRKAGDDERKELARKFEEKQKWFEEQNKELAGKLQSLAERLAAVESLENLKKSLTVPAPVVPDAKKVVGASPASGG